MRGGIALLKTSDLLIGPVVVRNPRDLLGKLYIPQEIVTIRGFVAQLPNSYMNVYPEIVCIAILRN